MSPFMKGALGFLGCAGVCTVAYQIGKRVGREEALDDVEREERKCSKPEVIEPAKKSEAPPIQPDEEEPVVVDAPQATAVERVREKKSHGLRSKIFGGAGVIKNLINNPDGKKLVVTVEDGDVVARISQKEDK